MIAASVVAGIIAAQAADGVSVFATGFVAHPVAHPDPEDCRGTRRYYGALRRIHGWFRDLWFDEGAEGEALRHGVL